MTSIEKSNYSNLAGESENINFGQDNLNELFKNLDEETKKKILKYSKKDIQISILKNMLDPELTELWNSMPDKQKKQLDSFGIRDRYVFLKDILKKNKGKIDNKKEKVNEVEKERKNTKDIPQIPLPFPDETPVLKEMPEEIFNQEDEKEIPKEKKNDRKTPQQRLDDLVKIFYNNISNNSNNLNNELEVRFGSKGIKSITRNDYDNVIKKLKSSGFKLIGDSSGQYYLRINCEFLDSTTGRFKLSSDLRTEIRGLHSIQEYCKNNDIKQLFVSNPTSVDFINKKPAVINSERVYPIDFDDFNFRVSYQTEEKAKRGIQNFIIENWRKSKKEFRFINRVSFEHPDYPFIIDISITKFANRNPDKYGRESRGQMIRVYTIEESNVFNNQEVYEIEIEINNKIIGPATKFNKPELITASLRKVIKYVLSGLQCTNYPVSYPEQKDIMDSYIKMIWKNENELPKFISSKHFIGPNSITLQLKNIAPIDENSNEPNIRKDFVVTDKADGQRNLMFISNQGKIYLINTNMDVIFTGAKTFNKECFNTIIDGELISHDKNGKYINLYAAFDIYYVKNTDIRGLTFMLLDNETDIYKSRYQLLSYIGYNLKPVSIMDNGERDVKNLKNILSLYSSNKMNDLNSPIKFSIKEFFPTASSNKQTIFEGCNSILKKFNEGRFEYNTDGLIFTHAFYGVGSNEIGKVGPKTKITWEQSFKWKPPYFNTVDFLVTTLKSANGDDIVKSYYEDGINNMEATQYNEYKTIELRCGFKESKDGYINPCQDVIDDKLPEFSTRFEDRQENDYIPMRFYPTEPYDQNAGICNIMLRTDGAGGKKMFSEENEVFEDNTIVEFRYDLDKNSGWNWIPLRVRYDKTTKLRRGEKEYGNSYKVCNENWKSIQPSGRITEDMLSTGLNIPNVTVSDDIYYNTPSGKFQTESMKDFHNLYVKKKLICAVSKQGDTLIDFACGKAGDLSKWINAKLSFVFGIDISKDNLENRIDGACARFLNLKKTKKHVPSVLFVNGNSAFNIKDGSAMLSEKAKQITAAVFGRGSKESEKIGKGVAKQYGKAIDGFNVSSCQFAIHYFFESPDILKGFMKNIAECTKQNGYFMGTCYDGKLVFNDLKKTKTGDSISLVENNKKIWEITKSFTGDTFDDNSSSIGYRVDVYQESINQTISEYLVNFDYLNRVMSAYGFEIITREEAIDLGLPDGTGLFSELFSNMLDEIAKNKFKAKEYYKAPYMTAPERRISFLNRYFIYKKIRTVNIENVELEISEYQESDALRNNIEETNRAQKVAYEEVEKIKPKVRKLSKKLLLVAATEAIDENNDNNNNDNKKEPIKKKKEEKQKKSQKLLIIESDDEE
jgi:hypothetical protein